MIATLLAIAAVIAPGDLDLTAAPVTLVVEDARAFDGRTFVRRDLFVVDGVFVEQRPAAPDVVVDVGGRFVVPARGDAHSHRLSTRHDAPGARDMLLASGTFSLLNACCPSAARSDCADYLEGPDGIDVAFANGGFTCPGGHPVKLYESLHSNVYRQPPETFRETCADDSFYEIASLDDLDARWDAFLATGPDLVKILLLYCDEYDERLADPTHYGSRGLSPELAAEVTRRAHAAGLRVGAHVETAADWRTALDVGVDLILHTPGYGVAPGRIDEARLTADDARRAAERGLIQVTTAVVARSPEHLGVIADNLALLRDAGVTLALGSDDWNGPDAELVTLRDTGCFSGLDLVRMSCVDAPRAIHPDRRLGSLATGATASFLVLDEDPTDDATALTEPVMAVKDGALIMPLDPRWTAPLGRRIAPLEIDAWIGQHDIDGDVIAFGGDVTVVDVWATWCAPCVAALPKIAALADEYADCGVRVVGLTDEEPLVVEAFTASNGAPQTPTTACDTDREAIAALLPEALRRTRPQYVIVGSDARVAWIGDSFTELTEVLPRVVDGTWSIDAFAPALAARVAPARERERILSEEDWGAARTAFWDDPQFLTRVAFTIAFDYGGNVRDRDRGLAEEFARRAVALTAGADPYPLHTLARLRLDAGHGDEALELQRRCVEADRRSVDASAHGDYYRQTLATYERELGDGR